MVRVVLVVAATVTRRREVVPPILLVIVVIIRSPPVPEKAAELAQERMEDMIPMVVTKCSTSRRPK